MCTLRTALYILDLCILTLTSLSGTSDHQVSKAFFFLSICERGCSGISPALPPLCCRAIWFDIAVGILIFYSTITAESTIFYKLPYLGTYFFNCDIKPRIKLSFCLKKSNCKVTLKFWQHLKQQTIHFSITLLANTSVLEQIKENIIYK